MLQKLKLKYVAAAVVCAFAFSRARCKEQSFDIWWHLATGRWIVEHRAIPTAEPFSYTAPGVPWVAHEWLADLGLYLAYRAGGHHALSLIRQTVAAATTTALYALLLLAGVHPLVAASGALIGLIFLAPVTNARPQFLMPLLVVLELHAIYRHRAGNRAALWAIPLLTVLWVNIHGGFLVLFAILALYFFDRLAASGVVPGFRRTANLAGALDVAAVGVVAALATLANPHGLQGALYPFRYVVGDLRWHMRAISEYESPDFSEKAMAVPGLMIVALIGVSAWLQRSMDIFDGLSLLFFTHSFLKWQRMVAVFGAVAIVALGRQLAAVFAWARDRHTEESPLVNLALLAAAVVIGVVGWPWLVPQSALVATEKYPARALEVALINGVKGNLFNTYRYGGYIVWRTYPRRAVFIDGRADTYPRRLFDDARMLVSAEPGWESKLRQYDIAWALLDRKQPLAKVLRVLPNWHVVFGDAKAVLLVRDGRPNEEFLKRWRAGKLRLPPPDFYAR